MQAKGLSFPNSVLRGVGRRSSLFTSSISIGDFKSRAIGLFFFMIFRLPVSVLLPALMLLFWFSPKILLGLTSTGALDCLFFAV